MKKVFAKLILAMWVLSFFPLSEVKSQTIEVTGFGTSTTHDKIPVYGLWFDTQQKTQMIYPAAKLTNLQGEKITKITLFTTQGNENKWNNDVHIRMACTTQDDLDGWLV